MPRRHLAKLTMAPTKLLEKYDYFFFFFVIVLTHIVPYCDAIDLTQASPLVSDLYGPCERLALSERSHATRSASFISR